MTRDSSELPDADELFANPQHPRPHEAISALADAGLLTDRQAEAYVRREIELEPRHAVAEHMDISPSTLDDHRSKAVEQVEAARETLAVLDQYRSPALPDECEDCGATLGGRWFEDGDGRALCQECAGVSDDQLADD